MTLSRGTLACLLITVVFVPALVTRVPGQWVLPEHAFIVLLGVVLLWFPTLLRSLERRQIVGIAFLTCWFAWSAARSVASSPDQAGSLVIVGWQGAGLGAGIAFSTLTGRDLRRAHIAAETFIFGTACLSMVAFAEYLGIISIPELVGPIRRFNDGSRATALMLEANLFGCQCALALVLLAMVSKSWKPWLLGMVAVQISMGLALSLTRAAFIGCAVGMALVFLGTRTLRRGRPLVTASRRRRWLVLFLVMFAFGLSLGNSEPARAVRERVATVADFETGTGAYRVGTWSMAVDDLSTGTTWLVGLGTDTFGQRHKNPFTGQAAYLGNIVLVIVYDTGLVGLALFSAGLWLFAIDPRSRMRSAACVGTALVCGLATNPFWFGFVWVAIALGSTLSRLEVTAREPSGTETGDLPPASEAEWCRTG